MTRFDPVATYALSNPMGRAVVDLESDRRWTYAELNAAVDRLAAWLVGEFGPNSTAISAGASRQLKGTKIVRISTRAITAFLRRWWDCWHCWCLLHAKWRTPEAVALRQHRCPERNRCKLNAPAIV